MSTELVDFTKINPVKVFVPGGLAPLLNKYDQHIKSIHLDPTTDAGRENIRSVAFKIAKDKNLIDKMGKELGSEYRKKIDEINTERNNGVEHLQSLQDEVRAPLTEFENKEKARIALHEQEIGNMEARTVFTAGEMLSALDLEARIRAVDAIHDREWEEFKERADTAHKAIIQTLEKALTERRAYDKEQEELAVFRKNESDRLQRERDEKIRKEAADQATRDAAAAQKKKEEKLADDLRKEKEKNERLKREAKERDEKAQRDKDKAVQDEKDRIAREKKAEDDATAKREANKRHRAKINNEVLTYLVKTGVTEATGKAIIEAIAQGLVPHVTISY